jgi:glycosyltransferase involved in cell wall biosynthesis
MSSAGSSRVPQLLVDGVYLQPGFKGVGRYITRVLDRFPDDGSFEMTVVLLENTPNDVITPRQNLRVTHVRWRNHLWHGLRVLPSLAQRLAVDALLVPYETPVATSNKPLFMVCHDVPRLLRAAGQPRLPQRLLGALDDTLTARTLRRAEAVFSNSQFVASWLSASVGIESDRLHLAPCAPGADFAALAGQVDVAAVRKRIGAPDGYILVISTGPRQENFQIVPAIYDLVRAAGHSLPLVVLGPREAQVPSVQALLDTCQHSADTRIIPFIDGNDAFSLAEMYASATLYLDPSLQEGFGMQIVEAMACGTPVVSSDRGALPEIVGEAGLLGAPTAEDLAPLVCRVLEDGDLRLKLVTAGNSQAKRYSWDTTAAVIREVIASSLRRPQEQALPRNRSQREPRPRTVLQRPRER